MKKYYLIKDEQQQGPYSIEELQSLNIKPSTLIWADMLTDWTTAKDVPELAAILPKTPPPIPKKESVPPPPPKKAAAPTAPPKKKRTWLKVIAYIIAAILAVYLFVVAFHLLGDNPVDSSSYQFRQEVNEVVQDRENAKSKEQDAINMYKYVESKVVGFDKDVIAGGIWNVKIKVSNRGGYTLDKVAVGVIYKTTFDKIYQTKYVTVNNLKNGSSVYIDAPNSPKGTKVSTHIDLITCYELGLPFEGQ